MTARTLASTLLCLLLGLCGTAQAAPFQLTENGMRPDVAVADDGTGHFVWSEPGSGTDVPDTTRYCRVPAGQTVCDSFAGLVPGTGGSDILGRSPRVFLPAPGKVLVLTHRNNTDATYAFISEDGGATFDAGREIARLPYGNIVDAALGPGNRVSLAYGAGRYQAAPLDGSPPAEAVADLPAGEGGQPDSVALLDPDTPMLAMGSPGPEVRVSRYDGTGPRNDAANWTPPATVGPGGDPILRTGPSGTFLYYTRPAEGGPRFAVRRLEGESFGAPVDVQDSSAFPRFGDFAVDPAGGLHGLWVDGQGVHYRAAPDGSASDLGPRTTLLDTDGRDFNARLAANASHVGFAVTDSNGPGVVTAIPFPPPATEPPPGGGVGGGGGGGGGGAPGPAPACRTAGFGIVEARLASGCFEKDGAKSVATGLTVRINGIDVAPLGGQPTKIVLDPQAKTVTSSQPVALTVGGIPFHVGKIAWNIGDGPRAALGAGFEAEDAGGSKGMLGFPIKGSAKVDLLDKRSEVLLHVGLPSLFKGLTGDVTLRADNVVGLRFDGLEIRAPHAQVGPLEVKDLLIRYMVGGNFLGSGIIILPPNPPGATLTASFSFVNAAFAHAKGDFKPASPIPVASGVFITHFGFGLFVQPPPAMITGNIGLIGGPQVAGKAALQLEGEAFYKFPLPPKPAHLHIGAKASIADFVDVGEANFDYFSNGLVKFDGRVLKEIAGVFKVDVGIAGFVDFPASQFSFDGDGTGCFLGKCFAKVESTVSSRGIAACATVIIPVPGLAYRWGEPVWTAIKFFGCDTEGYKVEAPASPARAGGARAAQASSSLDVKKGAPSLSVAVRGEGAVPQVELVAPGGDVVARTPEGEAPASGPKWGAAVSTPEKAVYFGVEDPREGEWTVRPVAGSVPIAQTASANGLAPVSVRASVRRGRGRTRTLAYRLRPIPGQRVLFVERSGTVAKVLGTARRAKGTLRFSAADGAAGRRTIEAIVEQDGLVREQLRVARYSAPGPVVPARPRGLRLKRKGAKATLTWRRSADAVRYKVALTVDDGRNEVFFVGTRRRRLTIPAIRKATRGSIRVTGLRPDLREGKAGKLKIAPEKKKRRKRRRG